jgi:hypothetical protein
MKTDEPRFALESRAIFFRPRPTPDYFVTDLYRGPRENHTQKKYVPVAMASALAAERRRRPAMPRPQHEVGGTMDLRSPSTLRLNRSNVKRKAASRGRMR